MSPKKNRKYDSVEIHLSRIAMALERIADYLENPEFRELTPSGQYTFPVEPLPSGQFSPSPIDPLF